MAQKKILFIITQSEFGGAQRFLLEFAKRLNPDQFVCIAASQKGELLDILRAKNMPTIALKRLRRDISPIHDLLAVMEIRRVLQQEKPDMLFLLSSKAGFLGALAARFLNPPLAEGRTKEGWETPTSPNPSSGRRGVRVIYRIGGWSFNDPQSWFSRQLFLWAEKISARWKDVIIVNSEHDREQAEELGIKPREKLVTIHNGIDTISLNFYEKNEAHQRLAQITPSLSHSVTTSPWIGCIANFYKTKGLPVLIAAMADVHKKNPDAKLVIIGDGRERKQLELGIRNYALRNVVYLAGRIPEAWKYLIAFDLFVLPSHKEGFPWVLLEAMAAEVPIVATRVGAIPEVITDGENGRIVHPGSVDEIERAIMELLGNENLRNQFAIHAKRALEQKFQAHKMLQNIEELL